MKSKKNLKKKRRNKILRAMIHTAPSPLQNAYEGILSPPYL
jgi:hypothetical protein